MENANKDTYTLGLDLGNATHALCVLNSTGEIVEENTIANEKESILIPEIHAQTAITSRPLRSRHRGTKNIPNDNSFTSSSIAV